MKAATRDWIEKAESDYLAAVDLARRRKLPLHDMVCFHCQQSVEKYLKGRLEEAAISFPKTHDLENLLMLLLPLEPLWSALISGHATAQTIRRAYSLSRQRCFQITGETGAHRLQSHPPRGAPLLRPEKLSAAVFGAPHAVLVLDTDHLTALGYDSPPGHRLLARRSTAGQEVET